MFNYWEKFLGLKYLIITPVYSSFTTNLQLSRIVLMLFLEKVLG